LAKHYKRELPVALKNNLGDVVARVTLYGVWPTNKGNWELNYTGNERLQAHVNFSVDSFDIEFIKPTFPKDK
jgi:hypothetical protein